MRKSFQTTPEKITKKELIVRCRVLFCTFFKIALFVVGGGLAMLPVIEEVFLRKHKWLNKKEILDMVVLTQTVPGLIAVNASLYVGSRIAGFIGSVAALIGVMIPSLLIICSIAYFFPDLSPNNPYITSGFSGIRSAVTGVFAVTAWRLGKEIIHSVWDGLIILILLILLMANVYPLYVIMFSMPVGFFLILKKQKKLFFKEKKHE